MTTAKQIVLATFDEFEDTDKSTAWVIQMCVDRSGLEYSKVVDIITRNRFEEVKKP